ncbi:Multidrug resistance-associated protein 1, partial [Coemansia sp. RSA 562]
ASMQSSLAVILALLSQTSADACGIAAFAAAALFAATYFVHASREYLFAIISLIRVARIAYNLNAAPSLTLIAELVLCIFITWDYIAVETRNTIYKLVKQVFHVHTFATISQWENGKRNASDYIQQDIADEFASMSQRLEFNTRQSYFVLKGVLNVVSRPLINILAIMVCAKTLIHYRAMLLARVFSMFATTETLSASSMWPIVLWLVLGLGEPIRQYGSARIDVLANQIQVMLTGKAIELYLAKNCSSEYAKEICIVIGRTLFKFSGSFKLAVTFVTSALSQTLNIYIVVSQMGWRSLIPIMVALVNLGLSHVVKSVSQNHRMKMLQETQPKVNNSFNNLVDKMRAIKFHAWESLFLHKRPFGTEDSALPLYLRTLTSITDIVGSAVPQIAAAFMLVSFIDNAGQMKYVDVVIMLKSVESLIRFIRTFSALPSILRNIKNTEQKFMDILDKHKASYIERTTAKKSADAVVMSECVFSWGADKFALAPITMTVKAGEFVSIIGKVGSGKSSFLSAICGEMPLASGTGIVSGGIGYVSQKPWIMNATFRENVLLGNEYNEKLYNKVIEACALVEDIKQLPTGDMTEIGHKGINISGGQKARLALARAIYTEADIYVLDDILSAVDVEVGRHIIEHVLTGNGLIAKKTRIMVTHAEYVVPLSDQLIVVSDGKLSTSHQTSTQFESIFKHPVSALNSTRISDKPTSAGVHTLLPGNGERPKDKTLLWKFIALSGYGVVAFCAFAQFASMYIMYYAGRKRMELLETSGAFISAPVLRQYLFVNACVAMMSMVTQHLDTWVQYTVWSHAAKNRMQQMLVQSLLYARLHVFERLARHTLQNVFASERIMLSFMLPRAMLGKVSMMFGAVYALLGMLQTAAPLALVVAPFVYVLRAFNARLEFVSDAISNQLVVVARFRMMNLGYELIEGHDVIRVHGRSRTFINQYLALAADDSCMQAVLKFTSWLIKYARKLAKDMLTMCICGGLMWAQHNGIYTANPSKVHVIIDLATAMLEQLSKLTLVMPGLGMAMPMLVRFFDYVENLEQEPVDVATNAVDSNWPSEGRISVQNLSLRYRTDLDCVLNGLTFDVRPREKLGVVGRTGAGKSSLIHALLRIIEADTGSVVIDGVDTATIGLHDLRSRISVVPQDPVLFEGTVRENLDPEHAFTDEQVWDALRRTQIDNLVSKPTGVYVKASKNGRGKWIAGTGLDKWVESDGCNFSVGQRQLMCLARALLWRRRIVVLDEATASVDAQTDALMQEIIRTEFKHCTVITVAHRLNTIMDCDRVLVMHEGHAVELDTPDHLLADQKSRFAQLVRNTEFNDQ